MRHASRRHQFFIAITLLLLAGLAVVPAMSSAAAASSPTSAAGWASAMPCPRPARTPDVSAWIETPGPAGTPVIPQDAKSGAGSWSPPTAALDALPSGQPVSAGETAAVQQVLTEISQCAAFPGDGVDAYFSDDFFRRTMVVEHSAATPGAGTIVTGYAWGFAGLSVTGIAPTVSRAWQLPGGKIGAIVQTGPDDAPLFVVFVRDAAAGFWLVDEMAYLSGVNATPTP